MELLKSLFQLILLIINPVVLVPTVIIVLILVKKNKEYKDGAYYQVTKLPYLSVRFDTGRYGEYLTYKHLEHFETYGARFLFNLYIPKGNGETTEIDVLMICPKGIFVFESKNYSGWIFGRESQKNWYQTLPAGRGRSHKESFYNPILQNRAHIKHLKALLVEQVPVWSIVVFSDRCALKSVQLTSNDISVVNRYDVGPRVSSIWNQFPIDLLNVSDIARLYDKLYPFTQIDEFARAQHIASIHDNLERRPVQQTTPVYTPPVEQRQQGGVASGGSVQHPAAEWNKPLEQQKPKCPRCNGNLVLRTATKGTNAGKRFYGCANYPKCKYIQNIANKTV